MHPSSHDLTQARQRHNSESGPSAALNRSHADESLQHLIISCLQLDPRQRPLSASILRNHPCAAPLCLWLLIRSLEAHVHAHCCSTEDALCFPPQVESQSVVPLPGPFLLWLTSQGCIGLGPVHQHTSQIWQLPVETRSHMFTHQSWQHARRCIGCARLCQIMPHLQCSRESPFQLCSSFRAPSAPGMAPTLYLSVHAAGARDVQSALSSLSIQQRSEPQLL